MKNRDKKCEVWGLLHKLGQSRAKLDQQRKMNTWQDQIFDRKNYTRLTKLSHKWLI